MRVDENEDDQNMQVDRVQLIAAAMHMHARVRPWNNVRPGYFALVMYLSNDIYMHTFLSPRALGDLHAQT